MKRWIRAITGLVMAMSGAVSAKELPNIDAFLETTSVERTDALRQARARAGSARIAGFEPRLGVPTLVWADRSQLDERVKSALGRMSAEQAARVHLGRLAELYQLSPQAADTLPAVTRTFPQGPTLVTFRHDLDGVEVFRESLKLLLNERHELIVASGFLSPHVPSGLGGAKLSFNLGAPQAIAVAFENLNGERVDAASLEPAGKAQGKYTSFDFAPGARAQSPVRMVTPARVKRVYFPLANALVPGWYVELHTGVEGKSDADYYSYVISARDGQVLFRNNLTVADAFTYRAWTEGAPAFIPHDGPQGLNGTPHPTGQPDGYQAPFVAPGLVTLQNAPFSQNDPWLPAGATETAGNNVDAYADISGNDGRDAQDFRANTTAPNTFDRVYDVTLEPDASVEQQKAAVTQLFYVNNFLHDWYYDAGFDELAGNAQTDNYGRGGEGGDNLRAEAQDFGGLNNANMSTPSDGARPRMQMFLFTPNVESSVTVLSPPSIDGVYPAGTGSFGPVAFTVVNTLVLTQDGAGASTTDACEPLTNGPQVTGKIAVMDRGNCNFVVKVKNAQNAGAIGALILNNIAGPAPGMGGTDPTITIPALSLSQADGNLIKAELPNGPVTARMYVQTAVFRDGTLDNGIVAHEWGHFISNRLIEDGNGLTNNQGRSMGEGWSDFHALLMMVREADRQLPGNNNFQAAYSAASYVASGGNNDGYYFGLRRYPYSTDFTKNPLTFKHIANGQALPAGVPSAADGTPNAEVHNSGEVWASMLWECYASLLRDTPRLTFAQAQARMKAYLVLGYQLTLAPPTFLDARDAFLAAAYSFDPADFRACHAAFARRGAGLRAQAPLRGSTTHTGVVESFTTGKDVELAYVELTEAPGSCDADGVVDNKEQGILRVTLYNSGTETLTQTTANITSPSPGVTIANGGLVTFPPMEPFSSATVPVGVYVNGPPAMIRVIDFNVAYRDAGQTIPGDRTGVYSVRVNTDDVPNSNTTDTVESNIVAWDADSDPDAEDYLPWLRYQEAPNVHYFYGAGAPVRTDIYLVSPPLRVSTTQNFFITWKHRYGFEFSQDPVTGAFTYYDGGVIELSNDGGQTWVDIGTPRYNGVLTTGGLNPLENRPAFVGVSQDYPIWQEVALGLGGMYAGQTVQVRFRVGTDVGVGTVGWDVDDIAFVGLTNTPFPRLVAESNTCGTSNPPMANAGPDQAVDEGLTVQLSGTATDEDGDPLTYTWTQTAGPAVMLSGANTLTPSFAAPQVAANTVLTFELVVSDGGMSGFDTVSITVRDVPSNRPPVANAGPDQVVDERTSVTLNGRGSSDPDGNALTYTWTQTGGPAVQLNGGNTAQPTFMALEVPANTELTFSLTVSDGSLSATDTVSITVRNVNRPPVANAGPDQAVDERTTATLDGRGSSDPDNDQLMYSWMQTAGPPVELIGRNGPQPTFLAPDVGTSTVLTFSLTVTDGSTMSAADTVNVTVRNTNRAPVANAGADQTMDERSQVQLNGRGSMDPDNTPLMYAWTQTAGPPVQLLDANGSVPTFIAPEVSSDTVLTFSLTVNDGELSATDTVNITVRNVNRAPVANAGPDQTVDERTTVALDGRGSSDPDSGTTLTYTWTQTGGTVVVLGGANTAQPTFTAPEVTASTVLTFTLTVSDATLSATDTVSITVRPVNRAPVANAGPDQAADERSTVTLDGRGSSDPDGDTLTYQWTQIGGLAVTLSGGNTAQPTFTAPEVTGNTLLSFTLVVSDATGSTATDTVTITVRNANRAPVANAGADQTVDEGSAVALSAGGSADPDGDTLTYTWAQTAGTPVAVSGATTAQPSFTAPNVTANTVLTFQVTVSDGVLSSTDTVNITVRNVAQNRPPVANAGPDQTVDEGSSVTLEGRGTDPDGNPVTYAWTQLSGPGVSLTGGATGTPTFTAPSVAADTVLMFQLTVSDGTLTHTDTVSITVRNVGQGQNRAPVASAGADQTVDEGAAVALDGRGSSDPDADALTYSWAQTAGPSVPLNGATTATPGFTAPGVTANTVLTFELTVSDGVLSTRDTVSITVSDVGQGQNRPPVANAGADQTVEEGASVTLSGSGTDPDGDTLTYAWTQTGGPVVPVSGASTATANFTTPDVTVNTLLTFTLKVTDPRGLSSEDSVSITVTAQTGGGGGGGGGGGDGGGCGCSSDSSAAGSLMPLLMIGMALLSRRRRWLR